METERVPDVIVALYHALADVQGAREELQGRGIPYPDLRMSAHTASDPDRPALDMANAPEQFWSLSVLLNQPGRSQEAEEILRHHQPFAVGRMPAPNAGRSAAARGAIAWRHYVFETPAATDAIGDAAGTTGNTGVISSGIFATGAHAEGNPPVGGPPTTDQAKPNDHDQ